MLESIWFFDDFGLPTDPESRTFTIESDKQDPHIRVG
jgi:hypothetical protein